MQTGDVLELDVTGAAHGGVFVARHEGFVVFVPDAIPGERVRARITQAKKSFARAEALDVLDPSPHRVAHVWRQADMDVAPEQRPGGADFGHILLSHQRDLKRQVIEDAFERFAGGSVPVTVEAAPGETPTGTGWRTRIGLHVDRDGRVGPFAARSHDVIDVTAHPLATPAIESAALALGREAEGRIDVVQPADGEVRILRRPARKGRRGPAPMPGTITESVAGREFLLDAGGFWQVHRSAATALDSAVRDALATIPAADGAHHLDLYGGVGLFAAALAEHGDGARVTTVEAAPRAAIHARENLSDLRVDAVTARVEDFVADLDPDAPWGVILMDPPRAGAGEAVVRRVAALEPRAVIYVACDPVALARDVGTFRSLGYDLGAVRGLDLFPNSHHVEAVAVLTRSVS